MPRVVSFDPAWWQRAAELGWTGLLVPEELGGGSVSDSGVADLAMVAEQLGKTVAPGPLYPVSVVLDRPRRMRRLRKRTPPPSSR